MSLPLLSRRGQLRLNFLGQKREPYARGYYDKDLNPGGLIRLSVAENTLLSTELIEFMENHFKISPNHLKYRSALIYGCVPYLDDALPLFLNRTLQPLHKIMKDEMVIGCGIGGVLNPLFWHLLDEGDGVLMTAPFYADYPPDILYPAQAIPVIVQVPSGVDSLSLDVILYMRQSIESYRSKNIKIGVIILCNPHNPEARAYPKETIIAYAALAEEYNTHLLVDEVFANEVFPTRYNANPIPFTSILSLPEIVDVCDLSRIHVVAGPTKDFGSSGVKIGALISQHNPDVLRVVEDVVLSSIPVCSFADAVFTAILMDEDYCNWYLEENKKRLTQAFELLADWAEFHKLPFNKSEACMFTLIDFGPMIGMEDVPAAERMRKAVSNFLDAGVIMRSSLLSSNDPTSTRCRVTFSLPDDIMKIALRRIEDAFKQPHYEWSRNV